MQLADKAVKLDEESISYIGQCAALLPILLVRRSNLELEARREDLASGDATRALGLLQEELQSGIHSSNVGRAFLAQARALKAQGRLEEAQTASRSAYEQLLDTLGPDHPETRSANQWRHRQPAVCWSVPHLYIDEARKHDRDGRLDAKVQ